MTDTNIKDVVGREVEAEPPALPAGEASKVQPQPAEGSPATPVSVPARIKPSEELAAVVARVEEAAHGWDVRADLPEGRFVSALMAAISGIGRVMDGSRAEFARLFDQQREAAKDELERAKQITKAANSALGQARNAQISYVVQQENLVINMIEKTLPMFAEKLQGALVVREKRLNADIQRRRYAVAGFVTLGVFLGGYATRFWQDADSASFLSQCVSHPYQGAGGHIFCDISQFAAAGKDAGH